MGRLNDPDWHRAGKSLGLSSVLFRALQGKALKMVKRRDLQTAQNFTFLKRGRPAETKDRKCKILFAEFLIRSNFLTTLRIAAGNLVVLLRMRAWMWLNLIISLSSTVASQCASTQCQPILCALLSS